MNAWRLRASYAVGLVSSLYLLWGCSKAAVEATTIVHPTLIEVAPEDFLGDVPCIDARGAMRSYVVTLFDLGTSALPDGGEAGATGQGGAGGEGGATSSASGEPIRNAGPFGCTTVAGFSHVVVGHRYRAEILGFEQSDLVLATDEPSSPVANPGVHDPATGKTVRARWSTSCAPITARDTVVRRFTSCQPLVDAGPVGPTEVSVSFDAARGELACGSGPGAIDHFEIAAPGGSVTTPCHEPAILDDVTPGRALVLPVLGYEAGAAQPGWGTTCVAEPRAGVMVAATCSPLSDRGSLAVDPRAASAALGVRCTDLAELDLDLAGVEPRVVLPEQCSASVEFLGLPAGPASVRATPRPAGDVAAAICSGDIVPGRRSVATCRPEP